ncbi:MAG: cupredoxin family copper-binding protein [Burkholderiales bacterium]
MIGYSHYRIAAAAVILLVGLATGAEPVTHTVAIEGTRFDPEMLTVKAGDTVVWINKDPFPHTATAQTGAFDSKSIGSDKSWKYTLRKKGVLTYFCRLHPTMKGTLHVE